MIGCPPCFLFRTIYGAADCFFPPVCSFDSLLHVRFLRGERGIDAFGLFWRSLVPTVLVFVDVRFGAFARGLLSIFRSAHPEFFACLLRVFRPALSGFARSARPGGSRVIRVVQPSTHHVDLAYN